MYFDPWVLSGFATEAAPRGCFGCQGRSVELKVSSTMSTTKETGATRSQQHYWSLVLHFTNSLRAIDCFTTKFDKPIIAIKEFDFDLAFLHLILNLPQKLAFRLPLLLEFDPFCQYFRVLQYLAVLVGQKDF